ncbi:hypothetical protein NPIL_558951 [Nephila pilipes]|uniref:Uncharacterized protein n=1 Tax=Nephila pilipes TaxID=299642 RepID=A0A8X6NBX9_NEPPI|nr:hypothetical protein NPIL_558951 [Nephila pilipes]
MSREFPPALCEPFDYSYNPNSPTYDALHTSYCSVSPNHNRPSKLQNMSLIAVLERSRDTFEALKENEELSDDGWKSSKLPIDEKIRTFANHP